MNVQTQIILTLTLTLFFIISWALFSFFHKESNIPHSPTLPIFSKTTTDLQLRLNMLNKSANDLSKLLGVSSQDIVLVSFKKQHFIDSSLNCPQPDTAYAQTISDGWMFVFKIVAQDGDYIYFANKDGKYVYCDEL